MAEQHRALRALYGARAHGDPRAHPNTVKALCGTGDRPQEICTPPEILEPLRAIWGGIALDPCGHPDSFVQADVTWTGERLPTGRKRKNGNDILRWDGHGLRGAWVDRTYYNPPYSDLGAWLAKAAAERKCGRTMGLFPVRPNRAWWRAFMSDDVDGICWLDPLKFVGYDQAFPAPLVLAYHGDDVREVAHAMTGLGEWTGPLRRLSRPRRQRTAQAPDPHQMAMGWAGAAS